MKTLYLFLISIITFSIISYAQTVIPPGDVSGTWISGGSPYQIQGEITIPDGLTLTIEPGVLVEFQGHFKLIVHGRLLAVGTANDTIVFTINDTTGFWDPGIPDGGWHGIRFDNTPPANDSSKIVYCRLEYGKAFGPNWPDCDGGAILSENFDKLVISDCLITNNIAAGEGWPSGGGISLLYSDPIIVNNTITGNQAIQGGGIRCLEASPLIQNNVINYNNANQGGGLIAGEALTLSIINNIFEKNNANYGGAINVGNSNIFVDGCTFTENEAVFTGGALSYVRDGIIESDYDILISNCDFINNQSQSSGGGVCITHSGNLSATSLVIDRCQFIGNSADYHSGLKIKGNLSEVSIGNCIFKGNEAIRFTGALSFTNEVSAEVFNCLFISNSASLGGGNWDAGGVSVLTGSDIDFMNCTFTDNTASYGAGLSVSADGTAKITNCIFWGNNTDQIALDTLYGQGGTLTVNHCDIQGGENSINITDPSLSTLNWESENIDFDPVFEAPANDDFRLQDTSPCIGAGIDSINIAGIWHYCPPLCYHGNPRPDPVGSMPDIGACESPLGTPVNIDNELLQIPVEYSLRQNYPNPFNPDTKIKYSIPQTSQVQIIVFDMLGNEIQDLVNKEKPAGTYEITWNAANLPSGVYFYQLKAGGFVQTKKMILLK